MNKVDRLLSTICLLKHRGSDSLRPRQPTPTSNMIPLPGEEDLTLQPNNLFLSLPDVIDKLDKVSQTK